MSTMAIHPAQELVVYIDGSLGYCEYHGTRAQLEEEGLIPAGLQWPEGHLRSYWDAGPFVFWLVRKRPAGSKGPRRQFRDIDWWHLRWQYSDPRARAEGAIRRKSDELAKLIRHSSPEGKAEWNRHYAHYVEACRDAQFQAFKALVPGLLPPPRVRRMAKGVTPKEPVSSGGEA